jgi:hypothetical protein
MNYAGKRKRVMTQTSTAFFKYSDFKKAVVTFDRTLQDVGLGMRVPELEQGDDAEAASMDTGLAKKKRLSPFLMPQKKCDSLVFTCS